MPLPLTAKSSDRQRATAFYNEDRIQSLGGLPRECALKYDNGRRKGHPPLSQVTTGGALAVSPAPGPGPRGRQLGGTQGVLAPQTEGRDTARAQPAPLWLKASARRDRSKNGKSLTGEISKNKRIHVITMEK